MIAYNHDTPYEGEEGAQPAQHHNDNNETPAEVQQEPVAPKVEEIAATSSPADNGSAEEVDKW